MEQQQIETPQKTKFIIPKIIHQIWINGAVNKQPKLWTDYWSVDYIKRYKDWQYKLWTEKEIAELDMLNKDIYEKETRTYGKADILRLEILYKYGGVYMDADSVWVNDKNLDDICEMASDTGILAAYETAEKRLIANGVIFCSKENPVMLEIINTLKKKYLAAYRPEPSEVSGPGLFSMFRDRITVVSHVYFYPEYWHRTTDLLRHLTVQIPEESYAYQYGFSTSRLANAVNLYMEKSYKPRPNT